MFQMRQSGPLVVAASANTTKRGESIVELRWGEDTGSSSKTSTTTTISTTTTSTTAPPGIYTLLHVFLKFYSKISQKSVTVSHCPTRLSRSCAVEFDIFMLLRKALQSPRSSYGLLQPLLCSVVVLIFVFQWLTFKRPFTSQLRHEASQPSHWKRTKPRRF